MTVLLKELEVVSKQGGVSFFDLTQQINQVISESNISLGMCLITTAHTTCSVFYEEYTHDVDENGTDYLLKDLDGVLTRAVPRHKDKSTYHYPGEEHYRAVESWPNVEDYLPNGDRTLLFNGDAHIKSTIIGNSVNLVVKNNRLNIGKTGYVYFADFDQTQARTRKIQVLVVGE